MIPLTAHNLKVFLFVSTVHSSCKYGRPILRSWLNQSLEIFQDNAIAYIIGEIALYVQFC